MKKDRLRHKAIKKSTNERTNVLESMLGTTIYFKATYICTKNVLSEEYVGKSVLFKYVNINNKTLDHLWVHLDNINNWDSNIKSGSTLKCSAIPYQYLHNYMNKPKNFKYSIGNVTIL